MRALRHVKNMTVIFSMVFLSWWISENYLQLILIQGDSMEPSYHNMQLAALNKYDKTYTYGDVIAFYSEELKAVLVKRVAAVPGDTVQIMQGTLWVNGKVSSVYPQEGVFEYAGSASDKCKLADGQYFVIGDHIAVSRDSRHQAVGFVDVETVLGKIISGQRF